VTVNLKEYATRYRERYASLIAQAARGDQEVDPEELITIASKLNKEPEQVQAEIEAEAARLEAIANCESRCAPARFEAAMAEHVDCLNEVEQLEKQGAELNAQLKKARQRCEATRATKDRIHTERTEAARELDRLNGKPIPRRSGPGVVNVGAGGSYSDA
jgi:cell division septum initiation protein DivIVA